jgi:hypothetical protein
MRLMFVLAAGTGASKALCGAARADSPGQFLQKLQKALAAEKASKLLVVVRQDPLAPPGTTERTEILALKRFIEQCSSQQGGQTETLADDGVVQSVNLARMPEPAQIADALKDQNATALLAIAWKPHRSKLVIRAAFINGSKTVWRGNTAVAMANGGQPAAGRAASNTTALNARNGRQGAGAGSSSLAGLGSLGNAGLGIGRQGAAAAIYGAANSQTLPRLNERILEFVLENSGKKVGNGQCWTLAAEALNDAGAQPPDAYDFGDTVELADLLPGDVLHFTNAILVTETAWYWYGAPDHVAVVAAVQGTSLSIYHQNVNGNMTVRNDVIDLATLQSGTIDGYRAVASPGGLLK